MPVFQRDGKHRNDKFSLQFLLQKLSLLITVAKTQIDVLKSLLGPNNSPDFSESCYLS